MLVAVTVVMITLDYMNLCCCPGCAESRDVLIRFFLTTHSLSLSRDPSTVELSQLKPAIDKSTQNGIYCCKSI